MKNSKFFLGALFLIILFWVLRLYEPFLLTLTIASLLAIATYNINLKLFQITNNKIIAASLSTLLLSILFFGPIVYIITSIGSTVKHFDPTIIEKIITYLSSLDLQLPDTISFLKPKIDDFFTHFDITNITSNTLSYAAFIGKNSAEFLKDMFLIIIFFFFANLYGGDLVKYIKNLTPLDNQEIDLVIKEVANVMSVLFYSILVTAIFEGALFSIMGVMFGYNGLLLGILYGFASLIPVVGGALMWVPICAYELARGNLVDAIIIASYSVVVISIIADTFIKPLIIKYINTLAKIPTKINELLIFFAIIAGLSTFGFWGMILGPAITALFISILKLYELLKNKHYM
ncbi:AI-2E family transporter [Sulfurospirillum arcachonense]|uniref:AI-2E family transporter n=1 Tax=Sulfurospirillum arcachonense TaxID=57666 RepID=UPI00046AB4CD|nr:AI-2E family transporter [Sulfurospirillum arcachonense]